MDQEHEYSLLGGPNRSAVGRYLTLTAGVVSSVMVFLILEAVDLAKRLGLPHNLPPEVLSLVGAGVVYAVLYAIFNRYIWRFGWLSRALRLPDLSGRWLCTGRSLNPDRSVAFDWSGEVIIVQTWDRIRVRMKTATSGSNSITAALANDEAEGYRLLYSYRNDPRADAPNLAPHRGVADLLFSKDRQSAEGEYFNGLGRFTFGTMSLKRAN